MLYDFKNSDLGGTQGAQRNKANVQISDSTRKADGQRCYQRGDVKMLHGN